MSKKTIEKIVEGGNGYVIQVKGNQKKLKEAVQDVVQQRIPADRYMTNENNRGRKEKREYFIYNNISGDIFNEWKGLQTIIYLISSGVRQGKEYEEHHYYISSRGKTTAKVFGNGIRKHWYIENKQHWVKDVIMNEDKSGVKGKLLAKTLSMTRSIIMNIYKTNGLKSIKYAIEENANKISQCLRLIENSYICKK